jgi:hypothetical protein
MFKGTSRDWSILAIRFQVFGKDKVLTDKIKGLLSSVVNLPLTFAFVVDILVNVGWNVFSGVDIFLITCLGRGHKGHFLGYLALLFRRQKALLKGALARSRRGSHAGYGSLFL